MKRSLFIAALLAACTSANAQWVQQITNSTADLYSIHFPTATTGYIAGSFNGYGGYLKTTDGGNTWNSQMITFAPFTSIHFSDPDTGTAVGYGVFFATTNSGTSWNNPAPPNSFMTDNWSFEGNTILIASGNNVYKSTNGGNTWSAHTDTVTFESFFFLDQSTGYAVGWDGTFAYRGVISKTTDQGATWTHYILPNYSVLSSIHFPSQNTGYAVGTNRVVKTSDGGNTWSFLNVDSVNNYYNDVFFTSNTTGHVVGQNSQGNPFIMSTNDGGNTWITQTLTSGNHNLRSVWCTDANTCFAAGDSGLVFKTTNAGGMSISEHSNTTRVKAYPNPFSGSFTIKIEGASLVNGTLRVYDVLGRETEVLNGLQGNEIQVNKNISAGAYFYLLCEGQQTIASGKIIAQ